MKYLCTLESPETGHFFKVLFFLSCLCFYFAPLSFFFILSVIAFITYSKMNKSILFFSVFIGLLSYSLDPNYVYGDVTNYYAHYYSAEYESLLLAWKYYRFFSFYVINALDIPIQSYAFFSTSLIIYFFMTGMVNIFKFYEINLYKFRNRLIFLTIFLSTIPFYTIAGFENTLSLCLFFYAISLRLLNENKKSLIYMFLSVVVHSSTLFFVLMFFTSSLFKRMKTQAIIGISIVVVLIVMSNFPSLNLGISFLNKIQQSFYFYMNGPYKYFIGTKEYLMLSISLCQIIIYILVLKEIENNRINRFYVLLIPLLLYFCGYRTMTLRFVFLGAILFVPIFIYVIFYSNKVWLKYSVILFMCFKIILPYNVLTTIGLVNAVNDANTIELNILDLLSHKYPIPIAIDASGSWRAEMKE